MTDAAPSEPTAGSVQPGVSQEPARRDPRRLSNTLYVAAWAVEIVAVATGLVISMMIALDAFNQVTATRGLVTNSDYVNIVAATLPFLLVAIVEATKIPVAGAAYTAATTTWRIVFSATLVFLAFITFETMLNGFERNFSNLTYVVSKSEKDKTRLQEKLASLESQREEARGLTSIRIEEAYNARRKELADDRDSTSRIISEQTRELKASIQNEYTRTLRDELSGLQQRRDSLSKSRDAELSRINRRIDERIQSAENSETQRRARLTDAIATLGTQIVQKMEEREREALAAGLFSRSDVLERYSNYIANLRTDRGAAQGRLDRLNTPSADPALVDLQRQLKDTTALLDDSLAEITKEIGTKGREIAKTMSLQQKDIQVQLDRLYEELNRIEEKFAEQQSLNSGDRERKLAELRLREARIADLSATIDTRGEELIQVRDRINREVGTNQVYRLAVRFSSAESAADLDPRTVTWVAVIWFGSLSAVVAITGILLALASYVVGDSGKGREVEGKDRGPRLGRSLRRLLISIRRQRTRPRIIYVDREIPKEVVREVAVDRVVLKEVPREIVVKEIVHVPMFTSDPKLLKDQSIPR